MAEGLRWHYDVTGAEPIIRNQRIYAAAALQKGTAMCYGAVATAENQGVATVAAPTVLSNIVGVLQQDVTAANALSVVATGVDFYAKLIINPFSVWYGRYSDVGSGDIITNTSADTTGKVLTATMVTDHERGWAYVTSHVTTGGFGNLFQIGASTSTTSITAATSYDDHLLGNTTSDQFFVMPAPYSADVAGGSVNLSNVSGKVSMQIQGYVTTAGSGAAIILENYIESSQRASEPLASAQHSGNNYKSENPRFYGDILFSEHLLGASGGMVNNRVIT